MVNRVRLAELLKDACGADPYADMERPMSKWDRDLWSDFEDDLAAVSGALQRMDATVELYGTDSDPPENADDAGGRDLSADKLELMVTYLRIQAALAPIRGDLEAAVEKQEKTAKIDAAKLKEFGKYVDALPDEKAKEACHLLFDKKSKAKTYKLKDMEEIAAYLTDKPFDLLYLQDKIERLVQKWNVAVFGDKDPLLIDLKYRLPNDQQIRAAAKMTKKKRLSVTPHHGPAYKKRRSTLGGAAAAAAAVAADDDDEDGKLPAKTEAELEELRQKRANLGEGHGEDPLNDSIKAAAEAAGIAVVDNKTDDDIIATDEDDEELASPVLKKAREDLRRLSFVDELAKDDEEDEKERVQLSSLPDKVQIKGEKQRRQSKPETLFRGRIPDEGIFNDKGNVVKRRRWTEEEKNAVKQGVEMHGVGNWVKIKDEYAEILRNRTSVQIKDVWRTMSKNSEV